MQQPPTVWQIEHSKLRLVPLAEATESSWSGENGRAALRVSGTQFPTSNAANARTVEESVYDRETMRTIEARSTVFSKVPTRKKSA